MRSGNRVGTMFGPYEVQSLIGVGGMGEVYRAYDTRRDRVVALKLLRPELAADPGYQQRFRRESRVAARLQEPHVIPVHDWGEIGGVLYIDMRLVEGANLKTLLDQNGPLEPARAAGIVAAVASALDAAHAGGLVHRDIKPENILLTATDFAYLADFGIAHLGGDSGLTSVGAAIGSCTYMAPERFSGGRIGPPSDIYSLTCVLYECLTGRPPFEGEISRLMSQHMLAPPPPPSAARPGLNGAFDGVIARGMAKDPAARFPSAGALAAAASAAGTAPPQPPQTREFPTPWPQYAEPPRIPQQRGMGPAQLVMTGAAVGLLAMALVVSLWLILRTDRGTQPSGPQATALTTEPTTEPTTDPAGSVPGADARGFKNSAARCDAGETAAVIARTNKSVLVVCQRGGAYSYRGQRLSDGASIELTDVVRSGGGWDVTNPADGTRYLIRPDQLTITNGRVSEVEQMVQYSSS